MIDHRLLALLLAGCAAHPRSSSDDSGAAATEVVSTEPTSGSVVDTGPFDDDGDGFPDSVDCDDHDPTMYPGAPDTWYDGIDSDCDHAYDYDADRDGDAAIAFWGGDCDDSDPNRYTGAPRICGNGVDDDCDALSDCDLRGEGLAEDLAAGVFTGTADSDAGSFVDAGDVDGDGGADVLLGAPAIDTTFLFEGPLLGTIRNATSADAQLPGGAAGAAFGDFDGDGVQDIATTSESLWTDTTTRIWAGGSFDPDAPAAQLVHEFGDSKSVHRVEAADLDDDGIDEMLIGGIWGCSITGWMVPGCIEVFSGPLVGAFDDTAVSTMITAETDGSPVSMPGTTGLDASSDVTGDGLGDVALTDDLSGEHGKFYVLESPLPAVASLDDAPVTMVPPDDIQNWQTAQGVATGDLDGDGYADLVLASSAFGGTAVGSAWMFAGPIAPGILEPALAAATVPAIDNQAIDGTKVFGDFDADGTADLALSNYDTTLIGYSDSLFSIELFYEPSGVAAPDFVLHDASWGPGEVAAPGDVDGDGTDDLLAASPGVLDPGGEVSGGAYLILGQSTGF